MSANGRQHNRVAIRVLAPTLTRSKDAQEDFGEDVRKETMRTNA